MINKPKERPNGLPICHEQIKYMIQCEGGVIERGVLRERLMKMGYTYYGIYEALRRLEWRKEVIFEGSGHSPKQKLLLNQNQ